MAKFVEFTYKGMPRLVNVKRVVYVLPEGDGAYLRMNEQTSLHVDETYEEAVQKIFGEGAEEMMKWRSVEERPQRSGNYLVTCQDMRVGSMGWVDIKTYSAPQDIWYCNSWDEVMAWMPLPEIYKV